ncbi:MAG: MGMT family protein [Bacteroidales bacterium]|nr:MGMT family protein [Bacteroidales bacterium]
MKNNFYENVFNVTRKIPFGKITSYGTIARFLGSAQSARMVGWALNKSELHIPPVPAHRVVNRNGLLTGKKHFANMDTMKELLENEGIKVENNRIVDFEKHFWQPE